MLSLVLVYDPTTRMLDTPDEYAGTTIDNLSADITVEGIPEGYTARLDFRVKVRSAQGRAVYPFLILDASGKCTLNVNLLKACKADLKLPLQLVLSRDAGEGQQEIIASKNIVSLNVSPAINAMGSIETAYGLSIERAIVDVTEDGGEMVFTRLDGSAVTINVDDDFVAWSDVMTSWPADPGDENVPSVKAVDDTFLKSRLSQPDRLLMTDAVGYVDAAGPRVVDAWSAVPSDDNLPTEKLVRDDLDTRALDADVVHNDRGTPVWSSLITYAQDSTVTYNGDLYISQNDSNRGNVPDEPLTAWWTLVRGSGGGGGDDPGAYKAFLLGDGASTDFVCNHGFNSYLTAHVIYSNLGDRETVDAVFERISKNRTKVTFYTAPAEGEFTCVIYRPGLGPESVVTSFNGQTGDVEITGDDLDVLSTVAQDLTDSQKAQTKTNIDLENVDNTRDAIKPVSGPQQTALDGKVDKIAGKGLSTEDFSTAEKTKLSTVEEGAEVNVNADWTAADGDAQILHKPTLGTVAERDIGTSSGQVPILNVNGKLPDSVIPPLAIGEYAGSVSTKAELVTLANAQEGDIAKVTADPDINNDGVWFLNGVYSDLNAWIQIVGPGAVISVNGQGGVVVLTAADVGAVPTTRKVNNKALASDIVLGASDVSAVPNTRKVNNKALSSDIALTPADVGAVPPERTVNGKPLSADISLGASDVGAVPPERTVNQKALSADIVLSPADVGAVPTTRKVNNKALSSDISLGASDVGAVPTTRKVNNKALSADVVLTPADVGAVPPERTVNEKPLSADVVLTPADVGAVPPERTVNQKALSADVVLTPADIGAVPPERTVNGHALSSDVVVDKADVGLGSVNNTSDADKPISNATLTALGNKVDKNPPITAGTSPKVSYDAKGLITAGHSLAAADIPDISATYVTVSGTGRANRNVITGSDGNIIYAVPPVLGTAAALNIGTESGNVPVLNASGKLADSVVPPLAIGDYIGEVTTKAGLTGFTTAQKGDIAKVTADPTMDNNGVYWLNGLYSTLTDWIQIVGPGAVISVQGKSGVVVLAPADIGAVPVARTVNGYALTGNIAITKADVGLGNAENTTDANKPISTLTQAALNAKQNTLSFDDAPTSGSSNPVKSGGVYSSIETRVPTVRTVNTKPLSADVVLSAADVGALASDSVVNDLVTDSATAPLSAGMGRTLDRNKIFFSRTLLSNPTAADLGKCYMLITSNSGQSTGNVYECTLTGSTYTWTLRSAFGHAAYRNVGTEAGQILLNPSGTGAVGQALRIAANGTATEWYTPSSSSLAVYNGSFTGNGTATSFTLNHGLTGTPVAQVTASGEVVYPDVSVSGTSIVVTFYTAPVSGSVYEVRAIA